MKMSTVILKGLPKKIPLEVLAHYLDKLLNTDDIDTFRVRERSYPNLDWKIALDFKTAYDAFTAQGILHGYKYTWKDGHEYILQAKINNDAVSSSQWKALAHNELSQSSLVPHMTEEQAKSYHGMLDSKLELLRKQKLIIQTEQEVMKEKKKLEREYRRKYSSDSEEDEVITKRPSRKKKRAKYEISSDKCWYENISESRRSRSRGELRSLVRELTPDPVTLKWKDRTTSSYYDEIKRVAQYTPLSHPPSSSSRSSENSTSHIQSRMPSTELVEEPCHYKDAWNDSMRIRPSSPLPLRSDNEATDSITPCDVNYEKNKNYAINETKIIKITPMKQPMTENDILVKEESVRDEQPDDRLKAEMDKALRSILILQQVLVNKYCDKHVDKRSLIRTLQSILARRLRLLKLNKFMLSDDIMYAYKQTYGEVDDIMLVQKLIKHLSRPLLASGDTAETVPQNSQDAADDKLWSVVDEVLQNIELDHVSFDDVLEDNRDEGDAFKEELLKGIKTEITNLDNGVPAVIEDVNNTSSEMLPVKIEIVIKPKRMKHTKNTQCDNTGLSLKKIPEKPKFAITVKTVLKKLKAHIRGQCGDINFIRILNLITFEIRENIRKLVNGQPYMPSRQITALYREKYPIDEDVKFVRKVINKIKKGVYSNENKKK